MKKLHILLFLLLLSILLSCTKEKPNEPEVGPVFNPDLPCYTLVYPKGDKLWATKLNYIDPVAIGSDPITVGISVVTSPDGSLIAYLKRYSICVIDKHGNLIGEPTFSIQTRSADLAWSHDSNRLIIMPWPGRYIYNVALDSLIRISDFHWINSPSFAPGDSIITDAYHNGNYAWIAVSRDNGYGGRIVSTKLITIWDEPLQIHWLSDYEILFKKNGADGNSGIYLLDLSTYSEGNPVTPTQVVADGVYQLAVSPDGQYFAYSSKQNGLLYGRIGDWSTTQLRPFEYPCNSYLAWSPDSKALVYRTANGIYWVPLNGSAHLVIEFYGQCWQYEGNVAIVP